MFGYQVSRLLGGAVQQAVNGVYVPRAAATLPQTATGSLFTVSGGNVQIIQLYGVVTVAIQAQATTLKLVATPTTGTANDLCGTLDMNAAEAGALVSITGLASDALQGAINKSGAVRGTVAGSGVIVAPGSIGATTGASSTGSMRWVCYYIPLELGAKLVAA
jgi:hypothetical protein